MDPVIGGALIKAGGGLLGGLFGKDAPSPKENIMSHMAGIRKGAEKYGFNPLAWAGTNAVTGAAPPNYMGAAIADATASIADAWSSEAFRSAELDNLEMQNEKLRRELTDATIRPDVPGMYGRGGIGAGGHLGSSAQEGWVNEFDADFTGKAVRQRADGNYDIKNPERTVLTIDGRETSASNWSDAEEIEKRYGDVASWAYGIGVAAADAGTSLRAWTNEKGITNRDGWAFELPEPKNRLKPFLDDYVFGPIGEAAKKTGRYLNPGYESNLGQNLGDDWFMNQFGYVQ